MRLLLEGRVSHVNLVSSMKLHWLRFVLLATFAFWASGVAKYTHEALEHHGRDASVDDDDDDDSGDLAVAAASKAAPTDQTPVNHPTKHPCPVCQMLAGMVVDQSAPPVMLPTSQPLVARLVVCDHLAPVLEISCPQCARGPPAHSVSI
jgi:hypothetical protein